MPPALFAAFMAMWLILSPAAAQTMPPPGAPPAAAPAETGSPDAAKASSGSVSHSVLKAITYKVTTTTVGLTIYSVAAGGVAAGAALEAFGLVASMAVYTANDYLWTSNVPPPVKQDESQSLNVKDEFWKTTKKYLTYRVSTIWIKAIKMAALYAYTGSAATTLVAGSAASLLAAGVFYANNMAWDYYDFDTAPPSQAAPPPPVASPSAPVIARLPEAAPLMEAAPKS